MAAGVDRSAFGADLPSLDRDKLSDDRIGSRARG